MEQRHMFGHWAPGSVMPIKYDVSKGWSEVAGKNDNIAALKRSYGVQTFGRTNVTRDEMWKLLDQL